MNRIDTVSVIFTLHVYCILQRVERSLLPKKAKVSSTAHVQLLQWLRGKQ